VISETLRKNDQPSLTVVILTFNEAHHIQRAIASVREIASAVLVVDSFSTDQTVELARASGARVVQNKFVSHSKQFQWGIDHGQIASGWIMRLDADEVIEGDLAAEIARSLPKMPDDVVGINLDRKHIFMGRWIRYGGRYPVRLLRIWRAGHGRVEDRLMDEHIVVWGGRTVTLKGGFADVNLGDIYFFTAKHNRYATLEAVEKLDQRYDLLPRDRSKKADITRQAKIKRFIKNILYNKLPFATGPLSYFFFRYFIQLGFLDGRPGLIYHFLQGFWYRFLVDAKTWELDQALAPCKSRAERLARLAELTQLRLEDARAGASPSSSA
jgi:glycosyltransferase involved in cell wall biosynthesis